MPGWGTCWTSASWNPRARIARGIAFVVADKLGHDVTGCGCGAVDQQRDGAAGGDQRVRRRHLREHHDGVSLPENLAVAANCELAVLDLGLGDCGGETGEIANALNRFAE